MYENADKPVLKKQESTMYAHGHVFSIQEVKYVLMLEEFDVFGTHVYFNRNIKLTSLSWKQGEIWVMEHVAKWLKWNINRQVI